MNLPQAPSWPTLKETVRQQQLRLDAQIQTELANYQSHGGRIFCGKGCHNCCTLTVNASLPEALLVAEALSGPQDELERYISELRQLLPEATDLKSYLQMQRNQLGTCPFLEADGACGVYAARPFACRALLSTRPADWCGVDFGALPAIEKQLFIASLDRERVDFPTHYLAAPRELAQQLEAESAAEMQSAFGIGLLGNLPYLVWLERRYALSVMLNKNPTALRPRLEAEGLWHPFLIMLAL